MISQNYYFDLIKLTSLLLLIAPKPAPAEIIGKTSFESKCQRQVERKSRSNNCDRLESKLLASKTLDYAFNFVNSNAAHGEWTARFELRSDDRDRDEKGELPIRSELVFKDKRLQVGPEGTDIWYGYKVMIEEYEPDNSWNIIGQGGPVLYAAWRRGGCDRGGPNYSFGIEKLDSGQFAWVFGLQYMQQNTCRTEQNSLRKDWVLEEAPFELGEWQDIVVNLKSTHEDNGYANIWINGKQVLSYQGPSGFHPRDIPLNDWRRTLHIKPVGIYKRGYNKQPGDPARSEKIVVYFDDLRIGKNSSYEEMKSAIPGVDDQISSNLSQDQTMLQRLRGYLNSIVSHFK